MTELAREAPGCFGARMTGAGLGGGAVALVEGERADAFVERVGAECRQPVGPASHAFAARPATGARLLEIP